MEDKITKLSKPKFPFISYLLMMIITPPTGTLSFWILGHVLFQYIPAIVICGLIDTIQHNIHTAGKNYAQHGTIYLSNGIQLTMLQDWSIGFLLVFPIWISISALLFYLPARFFKSLFGFSYLEVFQRYEDDLGKWKKSSDDDSKKNMSNVDILHIIMFFTTFFVTWAGILHYAGGDSWGNILGMYLVLLGIAIVVAITIFLDRRKKKS
jgi:hypothetical protein